MSKRIITREELAQHRTATNIWMAIHGKVYDLTAFMGEHPGGDAIVLDFAGVDASESFDDAIHSQEAVKMLDQYFVGLYSPTGAPIPDEPVPASGGKSDNSAGSSSTKKLSITQRMATMKAKNSPKTEQKTEPITEPAPDVSSSSASRYTEAETKPTKSVSIGMSSQSPSIDSRPPRRSSTGSSPGPSAANKTVTGVAIGLAVEQAKQLGSPAGLAGEDKMMAKDIIRSLALGPAGAPAGAPGKGKTNPAKMNSLGWVAYDSDDSDDGNPALKRQGSSSEVQQSSACLIL